jgi:hypothetical protein
MSSPECWTYDRARVISRFRAGLAADRDIWAELWRQPVPDDLKDAVSAARQAVDNSLVESKALIDAIPAELPSRFTEDQLNAFLERDGARDVTWTRTVAALSIIDPQQSCG